MPEDWKSKYDYVEYFHEGLAVVRLNGQYGFVDQQGNVVIRLKYDMAVGFSEGLAAVRLGDYKTGKYGFIDTTGKVVIPLGKYDSVSTFSEGLAPVKLNDMWGFVDTTGEEVVPVRYTDEDLPPFSSLIRLGGDPNVISDQISS